MLTGEDASLLEARGIESLEIRSVLTCRAKERRVLPVLRREPGHWRACGRGRAVGIIAAQSIGARRPADHADLPPPAAWPGATSPRSARVEELSRPAKPKDGPAGGDQRPGHLESKRITICNVTITADGGEVVSMPCRTAPASAGAATGSRRGSAHRGCAVSHEVLLRFAVSAVPTT
ncbi:MAG: hypothetical protein ACLS43_09805 [Evtepia gabavorous]